MLDYGNPSMKSQIKQVAAVDGDLFFFWDILCCLLQLLLFLLPVSDIYGGDCFNEKSI